MTQPSRTDRQQQQQQHRHWKPVPVCGNDIKTTPYRTVEVEQVVIAVTILDFQTFMQSLEVLSCQASANKKNQLVCSKALVRHRVECVYQGRRWHNIIYEC